MVCLHTRYFGFVESLFLHNIRTTSDVTGIVQQHRLLPAKTTRAVGAEAFRRGFFPIKPGEVVNLEPTPSRHLRSDKMAGESPRPNYSRSRVTTSSRVCCRPVHVCCGVSQKPLHRGKCHPTRKMSASLFLAGRVNFSFNPTSVTHVIECSRIVSSLGKMKGDKDKQELAGKSPAGVRTRHERLLQPTHGFLHKWQERNSAFIGTTDQKLPRQVVSRLSLLLRAFKANSSI